MEEGPIVRILKNGPIRTLASMPESERIAFLNSIRNDVLTWALGMGFGRFVVALIRLALSRRG